MRKSISGPVVEYITAIDVTRLDTWLMRFWRWGASSNYWRLGPHLQTIGGQGPTAKLLEVGATQMGSVVPRWGPSVLSTPTGSVVP